MNQAFFTDSALLEGLANGDNDSIEAFYRLYHPVLMKWMLNRGGLEADAEDVFQEALLVIYEKAKSEEFCLTCKLSTYLFAVSKRLWYKKLQQNNSVCLSEDSDETAAYQSDTIAVDLQEYWKKEQKLEQLDRALSQLGEPCKSLLKAFYEEQKNMLEIARIYKYTNAENAKNQKYKCLNRLRKIFFKMKPEEI